MMTSTDILVIGESVADIVRTPSRPDVTHPGGSPANVAFGLARLGRDTTLLTELGADPEGELIAAHLRGAGVTLLTDHRDTAPTPSAAVTIDADGKAAYEFDIHWTLARDRAELPINPCHVHFGSIGALLAPGAATVHNLVTRLRAHSTVSYDPNVRADLLGDRTNLITQVEICIALSDIVKASDEDIRCLYPHLDESNVVATWLQAGPSLVVITRGAEGAVAYTRDTTASVKALRVEVADTVGAGDSFMSAALDALASEERLGAGARTNLATLTEPELSRILSHAAAAAALTVSRPGASPPTAAELHIATAA
jgi:fructokinase